MRDDAHTIGGRRYVSVRDRRGGSFAMPADLEITGPAALEHYREMSEVLALQAEEGRAPWMRERPPAYALPDEPGSRAPYRSANALWLLATADLRGFADPRWGDRSQIARAGGRVRRGESGVQVVTWYGSASTAPGTPKQRIFAHEAFNAEQCDGLEPEIDAGTSWRAGAPSAREILTGPAIEHAASARPRYDAARDLIVLPPEDSFGDPLDYLRTAIHELGHWTGHPGRLDRTTLAPAGGRDPRNAPLGARGAPRRNPLPADRLPAAHRPRPGPPCALRSALGGDPAKRPARDLPRGAGGGADLRLRDGTHAPPRHPASARPPGRAGIAGADGAPPDQGARPGPEPVSARLGAMQREARRERALRLERELLGPGGRELPDQPVLLGEFTPEEAEDMGAFYDDAAAEALLGRVPGRPYRPPE